MCDDLSNKEIATRLRIEVATVKNHVHNVLEKLRVHRRAEAVRLLGRIPPIDRSPSGFPTLTKRRWSAFLHHPFFQDSEHGGADLQSAPKSKSNPVIYSHSGGRTTECSLTHAGFHDHVRSRASTISRSSGWARLLLSPIPGLAALWQITKGDPRVTIAVVDGR